MMNKKNLQKNTIGLRIKERRKLKGYSQEEIGKKINISQKHVSDYEIGRLRLSVEMLIRFSNALDLDINELVKGELNDKKDIKPLSSKLVQRMRKIETLPVSQQKTVIKTIDAFLKAAGKY